MRPKIHFAPEKGWMNDPNGLVFYKGEYHLFFQHDPNTLYWNMMHWGHAKSTDLVNWEELPIALYPDEQGAIFSGSAFVDSKNVSGLGLEENPALLLFYTSHNMDTKREMQCLAYTTDGITFHKYDKNPIIPGADNSPARDPQVFNNEILGGYSMVFTVEEAILFYHSDNLLDWTKTGELKLPEHMLQGMIECPSIFKCKVENELEGLGFSDTANANNSDKEEMPSKYVLMVSMDVPESEFYKFPKDVVPHSRIMQYMVGEFDGRQFVPDDSVERVLLVDEGPDYYAGTIFSNVEDIIMMAWLGDFSEGAKKAHTERYGFKGILSFPRKLTLHKTLEGYRLHHKFYTLTDIFESDICETNLCEGVTYTKNQDFETLIDGCVKEMIFNNGYSCMTSYID